MPFLPFWRPQAGNILQNLSLSRRFFVCHITCLAGHKGVGWRRLHAFCRPSRPAKALLNPPECRFARRKIFDSYVPRPLQSGITRKRIPAPRSPRGPLQDEERAPPTAVPGGLARAAIRVLIWSTTGPQPATRKTRPFAPFSHAWSPASSAPPVT